MQNIINVIVLIIEKNPYCSTINYCIKFIIILVVLLIIIIIKKIHQIYDKYQVNNALNRTICSFPFVIQWNIKLVFRKGLNEGHKLFQISIKIWREKYHRFFILILNIFNSRSTSKLLGTDQELMLKSSYHHFRDNRLQIMSVRLM